MPCPIFPKFAKWLAVALAISFALTPPGRGQTADPSPQEPDWSGPPLPAPEAAPGSTAQPQRGPFDNPGVPARRLPPAPIDPMATDFAVGVPASEGWHLPDLSGADSWFQMEGLRLRIGVVQIRFDLDLNFGYNDNIFNFNTPRIGDYITTISPTIEVGIGNYPRPRALLPLDEQQNYFSLRYTPSFQYYAINTTQNTVNEALGLQGRYTFSRLETDVAFSYAKNSDPTAADLGRQEYRTYNLSLTAAYALTTKTFFQLGLTGLHQDYTQQFNADYTTVSVSPALGYQVGPKLQLTLGPVVGITYVEGGGEQPFQGVQLGFTFTSLRKLTFKGSIGAQATQFRGSNPSGNSDFISPTFSFGGIYDLSQTGQLTLDVATGVSNSGTASGQAYQNTTATLGYQQRFWSRIQLGVTGSYQSLNYQGAGSHTDKYLYFTLRLGYLFWQDRCSTYVQYTRSQRFSEISAFQFDSNVLSAGISVEF
ncbi:MAG: outer membrane beta-barrel protein [Terrimicrobiaceae bacterium]|nr:outer membrane beta-barrel protein [Terrimicrobiaceae bacterium]